MTDDYLSGPLNAGQRFDNLLINKNRKPYTRFGSVIDDVTAYQIPSGIKRISSMWFHRGQRFEQSERHIFYRESTTYSELEGPTSNFAFASNSETNHIAVAQWNNQTLLVSDSFAKPLKMYKDGSDNFQIRTAGMPALAASPTVTPVAGANNYIYAFLYYYTYSVEGVTFEDYGAVTQVLASNAAAPNSSAIAITNIPVITNSTTDNYDTTAIKVKIYRTETDQTVLYYVGEVTNGTTTYNDTSSDATISANVTIYTTGGVVDNDTPPPAKYVHIANGIALYGHVQESSVTYPSRIRQSIPEDIDSCPGSFYRDMPDEVMGISSFQGTHIVFCKSSCYRVEATFDEQGRGGISYLRISDTVGTVSNDSIVQTDQGLFFAAQQGFYFTDGYRVQKITNHLDDTYKTLVLTEAQARNIWGAYDEIRNHVWWAVQQDSSSLDNDSCFILDLFWGMRDSSTFTTASNRLNWSPTALLFSEGELYRGDSRGFVFRHSDDIETDPEVDTTNFPVNWDTSTIIHDYRSCSFDFGSSFVRKFTSKILVTVSNITNIALEIQANNDDGRKVSTLTPIIYNSNIVWGDPNIVWGDESIIWDQQGLIEEKRHFPSSSLRCNYKQIRLTNDYTTIMKSDLLGLVTVNSTARTATFVTAGRQWFEDVTGYYLCFENDDYETQFRVTERTSDTVLTFADPLSEVPANGNYQWLLKGYRKGEKIELLSYVIHYRPLTDSQKSYDSVSDSEGNIA